MQPVKKTKYTNLVQLSAVYFLNDTSSISLEQGRIQIGKEQFIAIGLEKTKAAEHWEDTDYFKVVIVVQAADGNYYISEIEHPADILAPKYVNDDMRIHWVEESTESKDGVSVDTINNLHALKDGVLVSTIGNLYSLDDSRCEYTLTINDKPYQFYEKYIIYTMSASYEIWEYHNKSIKISPFLVVRCQFSSQHCASALEGTPTEILEYPIAIASLLQTSIFQNCPFKIWDGKVSIDGLKVTLESN